MKAKIISSLLVLISSNLALAYSGSFKTSYCKQTAIQLLSQQAEALNCELDTNTVKATDIDDRWYNPSTYIWYSGKVKCQDPSLTELTKMVQFSGTDGHCY